MYSFEPTETRPKEIEADDGVVRGLCSQEGLTDKGAFDTSTSVVLIDCSAPSSGVVFCSIKIPGLGLAETS